MTERKESIEKATFQEWSHKIFEEICSLNNRTEQMHENLEGNYNSLYVHVEKKIDEISKKIDKINELLNGNGSPEKGLIVRVDRLEQNEGRLLWLLRVTVTASLGAIATAIMNWVRH